MTETNILNVTLYTRDDCELCDEVKKDLNSLQKKIPHHLVVVNIDSDQTLKQTFALEIPVVEVGPYRLKAPISKQSLEMTLGAASDRRHQLNKVDGDAYQKRILKGQTVSQSDKVYFWISRHYLAMLNLIMFIYVGLPFLAPTLMKLNASVPARVIYTMYSPLCHQFGFRSFFLFGEQSYYPLKEAGLPGIKTFDQITGLQDLSNPYSVSRLGARQYVGDPTVGFKVALCERDVAIYGAIVIFGLIYGLTKRRLPPLHWMLWILIGLGPIGLDGFSQLFSQFNWSWLAAYLPYRESTPFLRVFTGFTFGFMTAWFAYPNIEESMLETRQFFIKKFAVAKS